MNETEGRKRLGEMVKAERMQKFRTVDRARIAARVSRGAWDHVEKGEPVKDFTLGAVEDALGWPAGKAQSVIDGASAGIEGEVMASNLSPLAKESILALLADQRVDEQQDHERGSA